MDEIKAAVKATWKKVAMAECARAQARVLKNMRKSILLKGGNFYKEEWGVAGVGLWR